MKSRPIADWATCHKLGYYVTYWYTGLFHKEKLYRALCDNPDADFGAERWKSGKINCPDCIRLKGKRSMNRMRSRNDVRP